MPLSLPQLQANPKQLSPLTLAFVGDGVYELLVRETITARGSMPVGKLHRLAVSMVRASAQARLYDALLPFLQEEELSVLKRGRNSSDVHPPKNADLIEYRKATGVEALFGYLYLKGELSRIHQFFAVALEEFSDLPVDGKTQGK